MIIPGPGANQGATPGQAAAVPNRTGGIPGNPSTFSNGGTTAPVAKPPAIGGISSGGSTAQGPGAPAPAQPSTSNAPPTPAPTYVPPPPPVGGQTAPAGTPASNGGQTSGVAPAGTSPNLATAMMGSAPSSSGQANPVTGAVAPSTSSQFAPVTPNQNLIGSQINLTPSAATQQSGQQLSNLASNLSNPDAYQQAAQGSFNTFAQQSDPAYQASIRQATAQAAANGGIGSGALSTTYGNLANQRDLQLEGMQQTAQQNALANQENYQLSQLGALQGVNSQQFGQNVASTSQLDQQQNFQQGLQQQAIANSANQTTLEGQLQNQNFNQQLALGEFGYSGNPDLMSSQLANQYGQVGQQTAGQLGQIAQQQGVNSALNGLTSGAQALYNASSQPSTAALQSLYGYTPQTSSLPTGLNYGSLPDVGQQTGTSYTDPLFGNTSLSGAAFSPSSMTIDPSTGLPLQLGSF